MTFEAIQPGLSGEVGLVVANEHTARHLGSGGVEVLATPQMVLLMERAAVAAVERLLPEGHHTVGAHLDIRHLAPTPTGFEVRARAELVEVEGRRLSFRVAVREVGEGQGQVVGEGTHRRYIVSAERFGAQVAQKTRALSG